jgi:uracil-DNA glycosylase
VQYENHDSDRFYADLENCRFCKEFRIFGWYKFNKNKHGNLRSKIWIVGTDPRKIKSESDPSYWKGKSKVNIRKPIEDHFNTSLEDIVYLTDLVKCQREGRELNDEVCKNCVKKFLLKELILLRPEYILTLGTDAESVFNIIKESLKKRGLKEIKCLPHPSPANGKKIKEKYPTDAWNGYRNEIVETIIKWKSESINMSNRIV